MAQTPLVERRHDGGYIVYEPQDGMLTRHEGVLVSGAGKCEAGLVLGKVAHALTATVSAQGTNSGGNGTFGAIAVGAGAVAGVYVMTFADATHYTVENPAGEQIGHGVAGAAFNAGGLGFTFTAGGTPQVAGDTKLLTVAPGSGKFVAYDP
ncbi:MAG: hypothetical protein KIS90_11380, partial [Phenylobacterium sp.]|nr:hypothetical protein [Phenylobacterium sp.]